MRDIVVKLLEDIEANAISSLSHLQALRLEACREEISCFDSLSKIIRQDAADTTKAIKLGISPDFVLSRLIKLIQTLLTLQLNKNKQHHKMTSRAVYAKNH